MGSRLNKRFVYNETTKQMEELPARSSDRSHIIMDDLPDFVSPVDGSIVHGRKGLRDHDRRNGVTNVADYSGVWAKSAAERARHFEGSQRTTRERLEPLIRAHDDLSSGRIQVTRDENTGLARLKRRD